LRLRRARVRDLCFALFTTTADGVEAVLDALASIALQQAISHGEEDVVFFPDVRAQEFEDALCDLESDGPVSGTESRAQPLHELAFDTVVVEHACDGTGVGRKVAPEFREKDFLLLAAVKDQSFVEEAKRFAQSRHIVSLRGLLELDNVVLTPHIGSGSRATRMAMAMTAADNLIAALSGRRPPNLLNPEAFK
jgi:hypothetical protein